MPPDPVLDAMLKQLRADVMRVQQEATAVAPIRIFLDAMRSAMAEVVAEVRGARPKPSFHVDEWKDELKSLRATLADSASWSDELHDSHFSQLVLAWDWGCLVLHPNLPKLDQGRVLDALRFVEDSVPRLVAQFSLWGVDLTAAMVRASKKLSHQRRALSAFDAMSKAFAEESDWERAWGVICEWLVAENHPLAAALENDPKPRRRVQSALLRAVAGKANSRSDCPIRELARRTLSSDFLRTGCKRTASHSVR
jgi:hypothetical protein